MITTYVVRTPSGAIRLLRAESNEQLLDFLKRSTYRAVDHVWRKASDDDLYMYRTTPIEDAHGPNEGGSLV